MSGCCCGCNRRKVSVEPMENFDVNRYLGRWHEIARLDHRFERGLERITATYTLRPDGKVGVVNRGYDPAKKRWSDAKAYAVQTRVKNYLKVYFFRWSRVGTASLTSTTTIRWRWFRAEACATCGCCRGRRRSPRNSARGCSA